LVAQIGAKTQQTKITGIWQNNQFGYQMTLMLNEGNSGEFDGESITYSTANNKLSITQAGATTQYTYSLNGNSLTLYGGDLDQNIAFTKFGTSPATQPVVAQTNGEKTGGSNLIGVWSGNGETIEFKTNGQCVYIGDTFSYAESQGHITLATPQGKAMFAYAIEGNQLNLTANGQKISYTRGAGNTNSTQPTANTASGNVAQELVGKWCWTSTTSTNSGGSSSSQCFVLNANGTYEYASERIMDTNNNAFYGGTNSQGADRGTWYVQGDRLYYNSQSRGQGSYQLQKMNHPKNRDPMIVLDGESYVTYFQKPSW
jgi:hypothetical protein